jgi:hypothetical protein
MATTKSGRKNAGAASNILGQLAALVPVDTKPKSKQNKWEMNLTPEARSDAERFVNGKAVLEPVEKRVENSKNDFIEYALDVMAEKLMTNKSKASNPLVVLYKEDGKTVDHQFQVNMTDRFKYRFPEVPDGVEARDHFVEVFQTIGLTSKNAQDLVDNELDFNPITGFYTLTELLEGSYAEGREWIESSEEKKEAGRKFAALLLWDGTGKSPKPLTIEEKSLVIKRSPGMTVKSGFYDRVATYCRNKDELLGVFKVIQPVIYPAYVKFAVNDTETDKTRRKIEAAADILGTVTTNEDAE